MDLGGRHNYKYKFVFNIWQLNYICYCLPFHICFVLHLLLFAFLLCFVLHLLLFAFLPLLKNLNFAFDLPLVPDSLDEGVDDDEADVVVDDILDGLLNGDDRTFVNDLLLRIWSVELDPAPELVHLARRSDAEDPAVEALGLDGVEEHHEERFSPEIKDLKLWFLVKVVNRKPSCKNW